MEIPQTLTRRKKSRLTEASYSEGARANPKDGKSELEKAIAELEKKALAIDSSTSDNSSDSSNSDRSTYSISSRPEASKKKKREKGKGKSGKLIGKPKSPSTSSNELP